MVEPYRAHGHLDPESIQPFSGHSNVCPAHGDVLGALRDGTGEFREIKVALLGDLATGKLGMLHRQEMLEVKVEALIAEVRQSRSEYVQDKKTAFNKGFDLLTKALAWLLVAYLAAEKARGKI